MRIDDIELEAKGTAARLSATVAWEECDRAPQRVYFETDEEFAPYLSSSPHAFLVASLLPAMRHGEKRIAIQEAICPELRDGLETAMLFIREWHDQKGEPVRIEAKKPGRARAQEAKAKHTALFVSGGVDSMASLVANRRNYPQDHPGSIKSGIFVHGFDMGAYARGDRELGAYERARTLLGDVARAADMSLVPVYTNVRHLDDDVLFWMHEFHGAALAAVAHALAHGFSDVLIASTYDAPNLEPWGSHPLLDPFYGSSDLRIRHDGLRYSRLEKVRMVAEWDVALQNLRVCTENPSDAQNCGRCEKCVRTMTELLALGQLARCKAFPTGDVSREMLDSIRITNGLQDGIYQELIEPLTARGRADLAQVIQAKSAQYHRQLAWEEERDWKGSVKRFDRRSLRGSIYTSYRRARRVLQKRPSD
jgi:hypothetical protein